MLNFTKKITFLVVFISFILLFSSTIFASTPEERLSQVYIDNPNTSQITSQRSSTSDLDYEMLHPINNTTIRIIKIIRYLSILISFVLVPLGIVLIVKKKRLLGIILICIPILAYIGTIILQILL